MTAVRKDDAVVPLSFDSRLREITRGIITETGSADPHVVASAVIERLTARQCREALAVCLPGWVRISVHGPTTGPVRPTAPRGKGVNGARRVAEWYRRVLAEREFTGTEWKVFGDCSAADLRAAAAVKYEKAAQTVAKGDELSEVATFMEEHSRETVHDIKPAELKALMDES